MKKKFLFCCLAVSTILFAACEDFLDTAPDNRVEWNTPSQITSLMVSAYSEANYGVVAELSSDNFIDNNSPNAAGQILFNLGALDRMSDEIFAFEAVESSDQQDSPSFIWNGCYAAIATANHALEAIEKILLADKNADVLAQKGEALLVRAYHHFILVNIFAQAYRNAELSQSDVGVPYITKPETKVMVHYERQSVSEVYKLIEKDLLAGIDLIRDGIYKVPKYRFNRNAANAFAARFYLYKRDYPKVIEYANKVLGPDPADAKAFMRNWNSDWPTHEQIVYGWIDSASPNNLMLMATGSRLWRIQCGRYAHNREAAEATIFGPGPTWSRFNFHPCYSGRLFIRGSQERGVYFPKAGEFFEYTDKVAQIGYVHIIRAEFTAEETLFCRAEARIFMNDTVNALADLKVWDDSRKIAGVANFEDLTATVMRNFYSTNVRFTNELHTTEMSPDFIVTPQQKPYIDCLLHYRRIETIDDGYRWFDLKRYGIEVTHTIGKDRVEVLKWNDPRRAIQIPLEVIAAGMEPNVRPVNKDDLPSKYTGKAELVVK